MLYLLILVSQSYSYCPVQEKTIGDFFLKLPESEEGLGILGYCHLQEKDSIHQPIYADCKNGEWQNINTQYCQFFEEQSISCKGMGIDTNITWQNQFTYMTDSGKTVNFEPHQMPTKKQQKIIRKFARKNRVSLEEGIEQWISDDEMPILLQERLGCILSTRPAKNILPKHLQNEDCLYKNPSTPSCRGYSDSSYAQPRRFHPTYLTNWKDLQRNDGSEIDTEAWSHFEIRPDAYGKWKYSFLYEYDPTLQWSSQNDISRKTISKQQRRFEGNSEYTSLLITSERHCKEYTKQRKQQNNLQIECLPEYMRVYMLGSSWYDSNHNRSVFAITGFDTVEIRDINIEVLPHPDLNLWLNKNLCLEGNNSKTANNNECEEAYRNLFTKYLFPDNYAEVLYRTLRTQKFQKNDFATCSDKTGQEIQKNHPPTTDINMWWSDFETQCAIPYTEMYQKITNNFDLHKYLRMTGNIFFIVDNKNVNIANVNTKGFTAESHFSLQSNDFVEIDGISAQGVSAQELIDHGVPLLDNQNGFLHTQNADFDPQNTYYMGNGIDIFNGRNTKEVTTGYGANCCIDPKGQNQCTEIDSYDNNNQSVSIYEYTNSGPSHLQTLIQTDFEYRFRCSRNDEICSKDEDCSNSIQDTCIKNRCVQECTETTECGESSYCIQGICRDHSCDTDFISISNSSIFNCTQSDLRTIAGGGRKENIDGVTVASTSGLIFNNHLHNFHCDSLSDLAQRRPCARHEQELNQWLRVERNDYEGGVVKTEGTSEPENGIIYANNHFTNVRLVDYHRKWRSYYLLNSWSYDETYREKSAFNQVNTEPLTSWHAPYFGSLIFIGNHVYSNSKTHLWNEYPTVTSVPSKKIYMQNNLYVGNFNSFYTKKKGDFPLLKSTKKLPIEHYQFLKSSRYPWVLEDMTLHSPAIWIPVDTIGPCPDMSKVSTTDTANRYVDTYGCFFGDSTSLWLPTMPKEIPFMDKISIDRNLYVHQNYNGEFRSIQTNIGSDVIE
jgi:hypothetical protein